MKLESKEKIMEEWEKAFNQWKDELIVSDIETALPKHYAEAVRQSFKAGYLMAKKD